MLVRQKFGGITYEATSSPAQVVRDIISKRELVLFNKIEENLADLSQLDDQDIEELGLSIESIKTLNKLTKYHKTIVQKLCKKKIDTMETVDLVYQKK